MQSCSGYAAYPGGSSEYPEGGETHDLRKDNKQPYMHIGKYRFEENDALQMAEWGFDFLKYDWRIDVWRQKDLGKFNLEFNTEIPHHGVVLPRMFPEIQ